MNDIHLPASTCFAQVSQRLVDVAPTLAGILTRSDESPPLFDVEAIRCKTVRVTMRDGIRLATDLYLPPALPASAVAVRTPYGRGWDRFVGSFFFLARRGFAVVVQDVRGTGDSEPASWDYYMYEPEDGYDLVEWIADQGWFGGFLGACGGSYLGQTQWAMAMHPRMSAIVPEVSSLGIAVDTVQPHMYRNAYSRTVGKGEEKAALSWEEMERRILKETLATGYYNAPLQYRLPELLYQRFPELRGLPPSKARKRLWERYCALSCRERAAFVREAMGAQCVTAETVKSLTALFGIQVPHDAHTLPHPDRRELFRRFNAPALVRTGWYDWGLNDTLATWEMLRREGREETAARSRLLITPAAHNRPGYHEGMAEHHDLQHRHSTLDNVRQLLPLWYASLRDGTADSWPVVIYYLMGANDWRVASDWPVPEAHTVSLYLAQAGRLTLESPGSQSPPDSYMYDPEDPTPTVGGSIVSSVYTPGSADLSRVHCRADVLTYSTGPLARSLDVVGPLRLVLYASSTAVDTDFAARLSDVFPDGRAIHLQSGVLRARYRRIGDEPSLLEPGRIYRLEIDMWATANSFRQGHRLRLDISSADFPRFERNTNRGGESGAPIAARQTIYHDVEHPSELLLPILGDHGALGAK